MGSFAELHLHLYGTIRSGDFLERVTHREVDWSFYEKSFLEHYDRPSPMREIVDRHRAGDPSARPEFHELFVFGDADAGSFNRFQAKFNSLIAGSDLVRLHTFDDPVAAILEELGYFIGRMLEDQARDDIGYAEQRMLMGNAFPRETTLAVLNGMLELYRNAPAHAPESRLAIGCDRGDPWPMWEMTQELALGEFGEFVTGIDFCAVEEGFPPKDKAQLFASVREFNESHPERALAILYHVGESFEDKSLESAVRWVQEAAELGAHRLGHAIALGVDPEVYGAHTRQESAVERIDQIEYDLKHADALRKRSVRVDAAALEQERRELRGRPADDLVPVSYDSERLAELRLRQEFAMSRVRSSGAIIEVCPTSNLRIGGIDQPSHHPVHRFLDAELPIVVGTDDPGIFDTTPRREIEWVGEHAGLAPEELRALRKAAWNYRSEVLTGRAGG